MRSLTSWWRMMRKRLRDWGRDLRRKAEAWWARRRGAVPVSVRGWSLPRRRMVLHIPLPGYRPEDIEVEVRGHTLFVRARRRRERSWGWPGRFGICREWREEHFALPLGDIPFDAWRHLRAEYRGDHLCLYLPEGEETSRRIPVRVL